LAAIHPWLRTEKARPNTRAQPIEEKESYRWLSTVEAGKRNLPEAAKLTVVADRESDIVERWARLPDARTDLLLRACRDRAVLTEHGSLFSWLSNLPVAGTYAHPLRARAGKRSAHVATLHVRFERVKIKRPVHCSDPNAPESLDVTALEILEAARSVVGTEDPIHGRRLTPHTLDSFDAARRIIGGYGPRGHIEPTFRVLKKQRLDVESRPIETAAGLMKLACLAVDVAVRSRQLTLAREGKSDRPATDVFPENEIDVLAHLQPTLEGKTEKQKNPHPLLSLAWPPGSSHASAAGKATPANENPAPSRCITALPASPPSQPAG
jgi:hypothetical protein